MDALNAKKLIVVDSSVAVKWLNKDNEKLLTEADSVLRDLEQKKVQLFAPELIKYEVGNALLNKKISLEQMLISVERFYNIPLNFIIFNPGLAQSAFEIAHQEKITYYDACFLALAQKLNATLVTDNPKHQKRLHAKIKVIALENYR